MKNITFLLLVCCINFSIANAQKSKAKNGVTITPNSGVVKLLPTVTTYNQLTVYELENRGGASGKIRYNGSENLIFPFANMKKVCVDVIPGKIAYLRYSFGDWYEVALTGINNNIDFTYVNGIRFDELTGITLYFNGISTTIHTNDCRRVWGKITVKVVETAPDNSNCFFTPKNTGTATQSNDLFERGNTYVPFNKPSSASADNYNDLVHNNHYSNRFVAPIPVINSVVTLKSGGEDMASYQIGKSAIRDGRVKLVITSNISSEHKMHDFLSFDYTPNVHMAAPVTETIPINLLYGDNKLVYKEAPKFISGPFIAIGDYNSVARTYIVIKHFLAHFTITGL